jgi:hypothetical protein
MLLTHSLVLTNCNLDRAVLALIGFSTFKASRAKSKERNYEEHLTCGNHAGLLARPFKLEIYSLSSPVAPLQS